MPARQNITDFYLKKKKSDAQGADALKKTIQQVQTVNTIPRVFVKTIRVLKEILAV